MGGMTSWRGKSDEELTREDVAAMRAAGRPVQVVAPPGNSVIRSFYYEESMFVGQQPIGFQNSSTNAHDSDGRDLVSPASS